MDMKTLVSTASILLNNLVTVLNKPPTEKADFEQAVAPFAVIHWAKPIIQKIGIAKINRVFGRLKRTDINKTTLRLIIDHFANALADNGLEIPQRLSEWRDIIAKYSLNSLTDYHDWIPVVEWLETKDLSTPAKFSEISLPEFTSISDESPLRDLLSSLWQAVRIEFNPAKGVTPLTLNFRRKNFSLVEALRANNVETSAFGTDLKASQDALGLPDSFLKLGPKARILALQNTTPDSQQLLRFLSIGAQANILEQVRLSLPSVASGVSCYLSFCTLLNIAPFPPTTETVARWSALFSPGKTYSIYINHLVKACHLMGIDISWRTELIFSIAKGLSNKPSTKIKFHNSLTPTILDRIIRSESWDSEFARLCYVTYLFMLRLPSEALALYRALPSDKLLTQECCSQKAVIGLREFQGESRLILKLATRKNSRSAFSATRPCFCGQNALLPRRNCPIHRFWASVLKSTEPGAPLFPSYIGRNVTRVLRAVLAGIEVEDSQRYSTHCFRRGAATAILQSGSTLSEIMRTGGWKSSSFQVYLDLHRSEELSMKEVLIANSPSSSEYSAQSVTSSVTSSPVMKGASNENQEDLDFPTSLYWGILPQYLFRLIIALLPFPYIFLLGVVYLAISHLYPN